MDDEEKAAKMASEFAANAKVELGRFKGLGEMNPGQLKETTMDPATRTLARVTLPNGVDDLDEVKPADLIETLMGRRPELRFQFIEENASFVEALDI